MRGRFEREYAELISKFLEGVQQLTVEMREAEALFHEANMEQCVE